VFRAPSPRPTVWPGAVKAAVAPQLHQRDATVSGIRQWPGGVRGRAGWRRALAALALVAVVAAAVGLWANGCGADPAAPQAPTAAAAFAAAGQGLPGPACELRAVPPRPVVALASVAEAAPAPEPLALVGLMPLATVGAPRDHIPPSRAVRPPQHPPNLVG